MQSDLVTTTVFWGNIGHMVVKEDVTRIAFADACSKFTNKFNDILKQTQITTFPFDLDCIELKQHFSFNLENGYKTTTSKT